ncbi:hydrogenase maturation nickel metallochaperone HypA [Bacteroidota bacterium]
MHELSIAQNIVEIAEEYAVKNNASIITEVEIEVGEMSGVVIEALEFAMQSATLETMLSGAKVEIIDIKGKAKCIDCQNEFFISSLFEVCPKCNSFHSEIISGKELRVKSILIE